MQINSNGIVPKDYSCDRRLFLQREREDAATGRTSTCISQKKMGNIAMAEKLSTELARNPKYGFSLKTMSTSAIMKWIEIPEDDYIVRDRVLKVMKESIKSWTNPITSEPFGKYGLTEDLMRAIINNEYRDLRMRRTRRSL